MSQNTQQKNKALVLEAFDREKSKTGRPIFGDSMAQTEEAAFPRLTSAELALVRPLAKTCDYADGDVVFRAGQPDIDL